MTESKTKTEQDEQISEEAVQSLFDHWEIACIDLNYAVSNEPNDIPYVVLDHEAYSGCEAHFFTIADMTLWIPELLPSGNVVLYYPLRRLEDKHPDALLRRRTMSWEFLTMNFDDTMYKLWVKAQSKYESSNVWAHNERDSDGYFEIPENTPTPIDKILRRVDASIKEPVLELNKAGFATIESCSGLKKDHEERNPFHAYVCLDDEYYHDVSAHVFTLAELAGWDPCWGAHGFDVLLYAVAEGDAGIKKAWERIASVARELGEELAEYRSLVEHREGYYYYRFRRERGLFSRFYSEEDRTLSGLIEELEEIDKEFYSNEEE